MKKQLLQLLSLLITLGSFMANTQAQVRYLDPVFSKVMVTTDVTYGSNISILPALFGGAPAPEDLKMDVYEPLEDTLSARPIVIIAHSGDFLPPIINQSPYGSKRDSAVVELCTRFAQRGFVAVAMDYRLGWNPFGSSNEKKSTILQAVYRVTQDMRTCVRYFHYDVTEGTNMFRVNPDKVAVGGIDAAGFAAENVAFLKSGDQALLEKFVDFSTNPPTPFIYEPVFGNPYADTNGDLCLANHAGYSSDVSAVIDFEGGLGEFNWIEAGDPPVIAFLRESKFEEPGIRDVTEGVTSEILIADGAFPDTIIYRSQELGNQDVFINGNLDDPLTNLALEKTGNLEGLFLFNPEQIEGSVKCDPAAGASSVSYGANTYPWNWYDETTFAAVWDGVEGQTVPSEIFICDFNVGGGNPNDAAKSRLYIDTLVNYISPRLVLAMGLTTTTAVNNALIKDFQFQAFPNPASDQVFLKANNPMREVELYDLNGKMILRQDGLNAFHYELNVSTLPEGMYVAKVRFDKGAVSNKIVIR